MTADRRAALVEKVADAIAKAWDEHGRVIDAATAAIDLIRAETLEEAAKVVRRMPSPSSEWMAEELLRALGGFANPVPAAIRALKEAPCSSS